jgi:hypothetical protein
MPDSKSYCVVREKLESRGPVRNAVLPLPRMEDVITCIAPTATHTLVGRQHPDNDEVGSGCMRCEVSAVAVAGSSSGFGMALALICCGGYMQLHRRSAPH